MRHYIHLARQIQLGLMSFCTSQAAILRMLLCHRKAFLQIVVAADIADEQFGRCLSFALPDRWI